MVLHYMPSGEDMLPVCLRAVRPGGRLFFGELDKHKIDALEQLLKGWQQRAFVKNTQRYTVEVENVESRKTSMVYVVEADRSDAVMDEATVKVRLNYRALGYKQIPIYSAGVPLGTTVSGPPGAVPSFSAKKKVANINSYYHDTRAGHPGIYSTYFGPEGEKIVDAAPLSLSLVPSLVPAPLPASDTPHLSELPAADEPPGVSAAAAGNGGAAPPPLELRSRRATGTLAQPAAWNDDWGLSHEGSSGDMPARYNAHGNKNGREGSAALRRVLNEAAAADVQLTQYAVLVWDFRRLPPALVHYFFGRDGAFPTPDTVQLLTRWYESFFLKQSPRSLPGDSLNTFWHVGSELARPSHHPRAYTPPATPARDYLRTPPPPTSFSATSFSAPRPRPLYILSRFWYARRRPQWRYVERCVRVCVCVRGVTALRFRRAAAQRRRRLAAAVQRRRRATANEEMRQWRQWRGASSSARESLARHRWRWRVT